MGETLYKALQSMVSGAEIARRGLSPSDDPHGYLGTPGTTGKEGAYFTTDLRFAISLAGRKGYRNGILVLRVDRATYRQLEQSGELLPDAYHPAHSVRVLPSAFARLNQATPPPAGREFLAPGAALPGGGAVPL